jgi:Flp pilus assembly protein TadG
MRTLIREERGSEILGFLLIIVPLCLFIFGALDIGGIAGARAALARASHAAVEEMQKSHSYDSTAQQALQATLVGAGLNPANVTVSTSPPAATGGSVWVILSTTYQIPAPLPGVQSQYPMTAGASGTAFP